MSFGEVDGLRIASVGVSDDAQAGVAGQDPFQAPIHLPSAIGGDGVRAIPFNSPLRTNWLMARPNSARSLRLG